MPRIYSDNLSPYTPRPLMVMTDEGEEVTVLIASWESTMGSDEERLCSVFCSNGAVYKIDVTEDGCEMARAV